MQATTERRPFVKVRNDGKPYILVHRKGKGMRARQITPQGWQWVREKYPATAYPDAESIPLTYDDYWKLQEQRDIHTERRGPASRPRPQPWRERMPELNGDTLGRGYRPPTPETPPTPTELFVIKCTGCGTVVPANAQFCSRCGRTLKFWPEREGSIWPTIFWATLAIIIVMACWHPWKP
jgi:predicted nucleic acid-binding Zn ribbon protein